MRPAVRFKRRWPPIEPVPAKPAGSARGPLPTTELHLHIEGTLEPELIFQLAQRQGTTLPFERSLCVGAVPSTQMYSAL